MQPDEFFRTRKSFKRPSPPGVSAGRTAFVFVSLIFPGLFSGILFVCLNSCVDITADASRECTQGNCKNGRGTYVYNKSKVFKRYRGDWQGGKFHGRGKLYYVNGNTYIGEFSKGKKHGYGLLIYKSGDVFAARYKNDSYDIGYYTWKKSKNHFAGEWSGGYPEGEGVERWGNGRVFAGSWFAGGKLKLGAHSWPDGDFYLGGFENGKVHGMGIYYWKDSFSDEPAVSAEGDQRSASNHQDFQRYYMGSFLSGNKSGAGLFHHRSGALHLGHWLANVQHGPGLEIDAGGSRKAGVWSKGVYRE